MTAGTPAWVRAVFEDADLAAIADAIADAESRTSAEIRVHLEPRVPRRPFRRAHDPLARARHVFGALRMERTRDRNAVLIYLAIQDRKLAIFGDEALHARVGEEFWARVRDVMVSRLRNNDAREAVIAAVQDVGMVLAEHFPPRPDDDNELPDRVSLGP